MCVQNVHKTLQSADAHMHLKGLSRHRELGVELVSCLHVRRRANAGLDDEVLKLVGTNGGVIESASRIPIFFSPYALSVIIFDRLRALGPVEFKSAGYAHA